MKKVIFIFLMTAITIVATAQKKDTPAPVLQQPKVPTDTITIDLQKVRYVKVDGVVHDLNTDLLFFITFQYGLKAYNFFENAIVNNMSKKDIDELQKPLQSIWDYNESQLKAQAQKK